MSKLTRQHPAYRHHKASGQAVVTLDGRDFYLGPHGTKASRDEYDRLIGEWLKHGRRLPIATSPDPGLTVGELILAYWRFAEGHYRRDGRPTAYLDSLRHALRPARVLYGHTEAAAFGRAALKAVRKAMIDAGLCRNTVNARIGKVRGMVRWAVEEELIPASVLHEVQAVRGLRRGRDDVRETDPIKPVPEGHVAAVLPPVPAPVRAMIELQDLIGMRPGEVTAMRAADIDRIGDVWVYRPTRHKTQHHGHDRVIPLGPRAQAILGAWLGGDPCAHLFRPADAVAARNAERRRNRRSPMTPSQARRKPRRDPRRPPGDRYDTRAYAHAIRRACLKAGIPCWGPNRLRHAVATRVRSLYSLEHARSLLGHKSADTTILYAERDLAKAREVMREVD